MDSTEDFPSTLDMDYNSAMGIDPSSLQFNPCALNFAAFDDLANPMLSAPFGIHTQHFPSNTRLQLSFLKHPHYHHYYL